MELSAPALRCLARLLRRNVHPHSARSRRSPGEGTVSRAVPDIPDMNPLRQQIEHEIHEWGPMRFSRYMDLCLYHPEFGYYSRNAEQFGKAGDFYTSSDVHAVFGRLLARQFEEMWRALGSPANIEILELGPGRGLFAGDVLDWSGKKFPDFFRALRYVLVEGSAGLRERIRTALSRHVDAGKTEVRESVGTPQHTAPGLEVPVIVFANEFFDALPVEVLSEQGSLRIDTRDGHFVETWSAPSSRELEFLDRYSVSADVYQAPGEQDITADVNFTALAAAEQRGMLPQRLVTQSQFLMGIGEANQFADAFEECSLPPERAKVALQLKHLISPAGMGESFHVLVASKGIAPETVASLSGLSFGQTQVV